MTKRILVVAALTAAAIVPTAAQAADPATPLCINTALLGPQADFGALTNPTIPGRAVAFDGSCSKATGSDVGLTPLPPEYWQWNFGDGTTASGSSKPSHAYAAPGTSTVSLTEWAYASGTLRWTATHTVTVLP